MGLVRQVTGSQSEANCYRSIIGIILTLYACCYASKVQNMKSCKRPLNSMQSSFPLGPLIQGFPLYIFFNLNVIQRLNTLNLSASERVK